MPEVPKIPVPSVRDINKFPWASFSKVMLGIIVALIIYIITNAGAPSKDCEARNLTLSADLKESQRQTVQILQDNIRYQRQQDSSREHESNLKDTINILKLKINESVSLSKKAVKK